PQGCTTRYRAPSELRHWRRIRIHPWTPRIVSLHAADRRRTPHCEARGFVWPGLSLSRPVRDLLGGRNGKSPQPALKIYSREGRTWFVDHRTSGFVHSQAQIPIQLICLPPSPSEADHWSDPDRLPSVFSSTVARGAQRWPASA